MRARARASSWPRGANCPCGNRRPRLLAARAGGLGGTPQGRVPDHPAGVRPRTVEHRRATASTAGTSATCSPRRIDRTTRTSPGSSRIVSTGCSRTIGPDAAERCGTRAPAGAASGRQGPPTTGAEARMDKQKFDTHHRGDPQEGHRPRAATSCTDQINEPARRRVRRRADRAHLREARRAADRLLRQRGRGRREALPAQAARRRRRSPRPARSSAPTSSTTIRCACTCARWAASPC